MEVIFAIVGIGLIIMIVVAVVNKTKKSNLEDSLRALDDFSVGMMLSSPQKAIALDRGGKSLALAYFNGSKPEAVTFARESLTGDEVETSGDAAVTKKTGFAKFSTDSHLLSIVLRITLSSASVPVIRMQLFAYNKDTPSSLSTLLQSQAMELANMWQSTLSSIIRSGRPNVEKAEVSSAKHEVAERPSALLVADELLKLAKLRDAGVLSEAEFFDQKQSLLDLRRKQ